MTQQLKTCRHLIPVGLHCDDCAFEEWMQCTPEVMTSDRFGFVTGAQRERERHRDAWARVGRSIEAALQGTVDESSPIANRLRMIADLAKVAQRHDEEVNDDV